MSRFGRTYPPSGEITFDGGSNFKYARALLADNESPDNLNCISNGDATETRGGTTKLNTTSVGTFACDGLFTRHDSTGSQSMVAWFAGTMYGLGTTTFTTIPSAQSVWTAGAKVFSAEYENKQFYGNGDGIPYKYDGTNFTRHGVYPPSSAVTYSTISAASNSTAVSTGVYYFKTTYINSAAAEGNPSSASVAVSMTCQTVTLDIPVAPTSFGVASRNVYVAASATAAYRLAATINDNSTTTYQYAAGQTLIGTAAPSDNGVPPKYNAIIEHGDRLFVNDPTQPNYVFYSGVGEPYTFSALDFFTVGDATQDLVRAFAIQDNNLIVFCDNSVYVIYMASSTDSEWLPLKTKSPYGTKFPGAVFSFNNSIGFPAIENHQFLGFAAIEGGQARATETLLTTSSIISDLISDKVQPDMRQVPSASISRIRAMVYKNRAYIAVPYGTNQATNNRIYVFDFNRENRDKSDTSQESWFPWSYTSLAPGPMTIYAGELYFGTDTATGFVYKMNQTTYSDDGAAINSYYFTKEFSGTAEELNVTKDFRQAQFMYERSGSYFMNFGFRTDSDNSPAQVQQIDLTQGGSLWNAMVWGLDNWSAGFQEGESSAIIPSSRGKRIQFYFSNRNTAGQKFKIIRLRFSYNDKGRR
jgi:hypothetical protein